MSDVPYDALQTARHFLQHRVSRRMPKAVIYQLELIEIDVEKPQHPRVAFRAFHTVAKQLAQKCAVRQAGQVVIVGAPRLLPCLFGEMPLLRQGAGELANFRNIEGLLENQQPVRGSESAPDFQPAGIRVSGADDHLDSGIAIEYFFDGLKAIPSRRHPHIDKSERVGAFFRQCAGDHFHPFLPLPGRVELEDVEGFLAWQRVSEKSFLEMIELSRRSPLQDLAEILVDGAMVIDDQNPPVFFGHHATCSPANSATAAGRERENLAPSPGPLLCAVREPIMTFAASAAVCSPKPPFPPGFVVKPNSKTRLRFACGYPDAVILHIPDHKFLVVTGIHILSKAYGEHYPLFGGATVSQCANRVADQIDQNLQQLVLVGDDRRDSPVAPLNSDITASGRCDIDLQRLLHDRDGVDLLDQARAAGQRLLAADNLLDVIDVARERIQFAKNSRRSASICADSVARY